MTHESAHRRRTIRLRGYDYSQPGAYFVTICAVRRAHLFGEIIADQMNLNDAGRIVKSLWTELPAICPSLQFDAFVVMPNHIHGIIVILAATANDQPAVGAGSPRPVRGAGTAPLQSRRLTLGQIVARFKYESTKRIGALRGGGAGASGNAGTTIASSAGASRLIASVGMSSRTLPGGPTTSKTRRLFVRLPRSHGSTGDAAPSSGLV